MKHMDTTLFTLAVAVQGVVQLHRQVNWLSGTETLGVPYRHNLEVEIQWTSHFWGLQGSGAGVRIEPIVGFCYL